MKLWQTLRRLFAKFARRGALKIVVDTNILISGTIIRHGAPARILDLAQQRRIILVISPAILSEYLEVIQRPHITKKYKRIEQRTEILIRFLQAGALIVTPRTVERVVYDDPDDDFVLAAAVEGKADYIVSGDKHLNELGQYRGIKILTPREFVTTVLE